MHANVAQTSKDADKHKPIYVHNLWKDYQVMKITFSNADHGGDNATLHHKIFKNPDATDPYVHFAGIRQWGNAYFYGIAARKSIESGDPINIAELTDWNLGKKEYKLLFRFWKISHLTIPRIFIKVLRVLISYSSILGLL
ncbi:hypothetical protein [Galbibacter mesophilus]|uniref:hypothetical protein n=1 Tax=Galbibacter mesophilus TaxID=379069 RepID=UPI001F5D6130|nr:hypothetical protein [Galbibacter mesophilus]MCM5664047.1 hypothetical protein [Galbibacter mesophilus]